MKTINVDQFEESTVYSWGCPECGHYNTQSDIETRNTCVRCDEQFVLIEDD